MKTCMLGEVAQLRSGKTCQSVPFSGIRYIRISDVKPYNILGDDRVSPSAEDNLLMNGEILIPRTGKYMRPYLYQATDGPACYASFFYKIHTVSCDPLLLYYQLCSKRFQNWIQTVKTGRNVTLDALRKYPFLREANIPVLVLNLAERQIREQLDLVRLMEERLQSYLKGKYIENCNTTIGTLCEPLPSGNPGEGGSTPVIGTSGICGYSNKPGYGSEAVGISKNGFPHLYRIPKGAVGGPQMFCVNPLIPASCLYDILTAAGLDKYVSKGPIPHLYFKDIRDIPCRYLHEDRPDAANLLKEQLSEAKQSLREMEDRYQLLLDKAFPQ